MHRVPLRLTKTDKQLTQDDWSLGVSSQEHKALDPKQHNNKHTRNSDEVPDAHMENYLGTFHRPTTFFRKQVLQITIQC